MDSKELCKEAIRISGIDPRKCMKCGKCSATCPAFEDMDIHPHEFVSMLTEESTDFLNRNRFGAAFPASPASKDVRGELNPQD